MRAQCFEGGNRESTRICANGLVLCWEENHDPPRRNTKCSDGCSASALLVDTYKEQAQFYSGFTHGGWGVDMLAQ